MRVIDLTGLIEEQMWVYPPPITAPVIEQIADLDGPAGWEAYRLTLCSLTSTYLETSAHLLKNGELIDQINPERFVRPASILQLPDYPPGYPITPDDLTSASVNPHKDDAVLVATGWDRMWNDPRYVVDSPYFTTEAMQWLVSTGASIIGGDIPCFNNTANSINVNEILFKSGILLLAPLINLRQTAGMQRPLIVALPLRVKGVCGTPCRVIPIEF